MYICDFDDKYLGHHQQQITSLYSGCEVHTRKFDAADEPAVKEVVDDALRRYGRLDVFFANAGITGFPTPFTDVTEEDFMETLRVNTLGCVHQSRPPHRLQKSMGASSSFHEGAENQCCQSSDQS